MVYEKLRTSLGLAILFEDSFTGTLPHGNVEFKIKGNLEQKITKKNNGALLFLEPVSGIPFNITVRSEFYHDATISFIDSKYNDSIKYNVGGINFETNIAGPIKLFPKPNYPFTLSDFILRGMLCPIEKDAIYKIGIDKYSCYTIATQNGDFVLPIDVTSEHLVHFIISFINYDPELNFDLTITKYVKKLNTFESQLEFKHQVKASKIGAHQSWKN